MQTPIYIYCPTIEPEWIDLSSNESHFAIGLLRQFPKKINWYHLSANPADAALDLLEKHPDRICPFQLGRNTNPRAARLFDKYKFTRYGGSLSPNSADYALDWLEANRSQIEWDYLASNSSPRALEMMENNWCGQIYLSNLFINPSDRAIQLACKHFTLEYILSTQGKSILSANPCDAALDILLNHPDAINWQYFSTNPSPRAVQHLAKQPDKIDWQLIFQNPSEQVVPLLRDYMSRTPKLSDIQWKRLCRYHAQHFPELFAKLDYAEMRKRWAPFKEELETVVLSPDYLLSISKRYGVDFKTVLRLW
jgi:hypothetical protein